MGRACNTIGERRNACKLVMGKPEGNRLLGRRRPRWADNVKIELGWMRWSGLDSTDLVRDREQWRARVQTVIKPSASIDILGRSLVVARLAPSRIELRSVNTVICLATNRNFETVYRLLRTISIGASVIKLRLHYDIDLLVFSIQTNKLRGPQSASELYRLSDRHLSTKFRANFCG
jgi:hypothetical protein